MLVNVLSICSDNELTVEEEEEEDGSEGRHIVPVDPYCLLIVGDRSICLGCCQQICSQSIFFWSIITLAQLFVYLLSR